MEDNKSRIDRLQQKLDSQNYVPHHEDVTLHDKQYNLQNDWGANAAVVSSPSILEKIGIFRMFLGAAFLFFLGSLAYAAFIFTRDNQPTGGDDVTINVVGPVSVAGGEKLSLDVLIQNNNTVPIELADLVVDYPEGSKSSIDISEDLRRTREDIGTIEPGAIVRRTIHSVLFGEENSTKTLVVGTDYSLQGSTAIFEKRKSFEIALNASPIRLSIDALREISAGQELEFKITVTSNSNTPLSNVILTAAYPFGFMFKSSDVTPALGNNTWVIPKLQPQQSYVITLRGLVEGQNLEDRFFKFATGLVKEGTANEMGVVFNSTTHLTTIQKAFINLSLLIDGNAGELTTVASGGTANGEIVFSNNTNDIIRDVRIDVNIQGNAIDKKTVEAEKGFYNSGSNTIEWNTETDDSFKELRPRETLRIQFRFDTLDLAAGGINLRNPEVKLRANATGIRVSNDRAEEKIDTIARTDVRVQSDVPVRAYTMSNDGPFSNTGPIPPTVEQETTYTIMFEVQNNSNDLKNARIEAILPSYVAWNNLSYPEGENVVFDYQTRKLVWNIGAIPAGTGYSQKAKTLAVKVTLTPSFSQLGTAPELLKNTVFNAMDAFTETTISKTLPVVTTKIYNFPIGNSHQNVVE